MSSVDPITLQVLIGGLRAACDEMGAALIRSAYSANIKERHDCSTALFDARGELVMQAEHIPVHLGSMPDAVAAVLGEEQRPGESWILNDPYRGGTHLPDITLIAPVFVRGSLTGFAACRAHHADVGGPTPGSMPARSQDARRRGRRDPADAGRHAPAARDRRPDALPGAAPRRPARPARRRTGSAPCASPSSPSATASSCCAPGWTRSSPTPSAAPGRRWPSCPTAPTRPRTCSRTTPAGSPRDVTPAGRGDDRRRAPRARLRRHRRPGRRQPQLPALGDQVGGLLRRPGPDRPRRPALGRGLPADRGPRARGLPAQRPAARRPSSPATPRPRAGSPTS